ncbi:hypothetical protein CgunFtcFv8_018309 [Champsocephalus gunnari]|uniref:C2H2-type domain-containing protein n=1 Tax=Champsocephalus gunnari TaxID=52237 RepID=A0AAN8BTU6_CHAGU|nr:hypothetical protein CgunFtcFv8_018309 [Champsocephalus gunnari]
MKEEVKEEEEEEEDGEGKGEKEEEKESSSSLLTERGGHRCLICGWRTKHRGLAISHVVRKHDIPKAYAGQGVKYAAPPRRGEEGEFMSKELMKEEIEATNKVVGLISNRYVCLLCGWKTKRKGFAISHVVRSHDVERPYSCRSCDRSFFLPSRLQQHVSASHPLGRFRCPFCCFRSQFLGGFRRHCSRCNARDEEEEEEEEERRREEQGGRGAGREERHEEEEEDSKGSGKGGGGRRGGLKGFCPDDQ